VPKDLPNTFTDIAAGTPLANLVTDAFRKATEADIGFSANGMIRAGLTRGKTGVQTVYDVFTVAPLGAGVVDMTAGSALVTAYLTGQELKNVLEFLLIDSPAHPGEYFPRASGMRFHYDKSRPTFDVVTEIELGDLDRGYRAIDISGKDERLFSLTCPLYLGIILVAIPKYTKGKLTLAPKNKTGRPLGSRVEALNDPRIVDKLWIHRIDGHCPCRDLLGKRCSSHRRKRHDQRRELAVHEFQRPQSGDPIGICWCKVKLQLRNAPEEIAPQAQMP
jgi:5'-nucleotidase/UDP-sugar diphosphatase